MRARDAAPIGHPAPAQRSTPAADCSRLAPAVRPLVLIALVALLAMLVQPRAARAREPPSSNPGSLTDVGGRLFFTADDGFTPTGKHLKPDHCTGDVVLSIDDEQVGALTGIRMAAMYSAMTGYGIRSAGTPGHR